MTTPRPTEAHETPLNIGVLDNYLMTCITQPVAWLTISRGAEITISADLTWDDEAQTYPIRIMFGDQQQVSISILPEDAAVLVDRLTSVLEHGL